MTSEIYEKAESLALRITFIFIFFLFINIVYKRGGKKFKFGS